MTIALLGFLAAFVLIFLRVPIFVALALTGISGFAVLVNWKAALSMVAIVSFELANETSLSVIPLFVLMGNIVAGTGISDSLYRSAQTFIGHRRDGLALATVAACGGFAAICGSSVATIVTMGKVALPSMRSYKYDDALSSAVIAAGATLGILIPPSILIIIYGVLTETNIGALYAAALIPGIIGILFYMIAVRISLRLRPDAAPAAERFSWPERIRSLSLAWPALLLFVFVIGGIYSGFFTATEAAGFGAFGAMVIGLLQRRLGFVAFYNILLESILTSAVLFMLVIGAAIFTEFLNLTGAHLALLNFVQGSGFSPGMIIFVICVIYIILGMFMEGLSMVLLTVPMFFPIVLGLGYDPVWFGILLVILVELGLITPPIGLNLFVIKNVARDIPISTVIKGIIPFIAMDLVRIAVIAAFPVVTLLLPELLFD